MKRLRRITPEEKAYLDAEVAAGRMISTEHPSLEYQRALSEQQRVHGVGWGFQEMARLFRDEEAKDETEDDE